MLFNNMVLLSNIFDFADKSVKDNLFPFTPVGWSDILLKLFLRMLLDSLDMTAGQVSTCCLKQSIPGSTPLPFLLRSEVRVCA